MKRKPNQITDDTDYLNIRKSIRELIRVNRKAKGHHFKWYIKLLKQVKQEVDGHLRSKGVL